MSQSLEDAISRKLASFTAELVELYRDAVRSAMAEVVARVESRVRGPVASVAVETPRIRVRAARVPRGRHRRTMSEIDSTAIAITKYVAAHPGSTAETIKKALGIARNGWNVPVAKLLADGKVRRSGTKRTTKYFAAS